MSDRDVIRMPDPQSFRSRRLQTVICAAIRAWQPIEFSYGGHSRIVEPHTFGNLRDGRLALCGYQVGGGSGSGAAVGWKTFDAAKIRGVNPLSGHFRGPRKAYRKGDRAFRTIACELEDP